jgi:hypothetical protein
MPAVARVSQQSSEFNVIALFDKVGVWVNQKMGESQALSCTKGLCRKCCCAKLGERYSHP